MKKFYLAVFIFVSNFAIADVSPEQLNEVSHLLDFVKNSGCIINRNGTDYPAEKGLEHINNKYNYFRDDIKTTEDFIMLAASRSTMSGKHYKVRCPGMKTLTTQDWLLAELKQYRVK